MSNSRTKNAVLNIIVSLALQCVTFIRGLILPRIIIPLYGSDINGLVSSISQFLAYISLLEAGVGSIFRASLYKPLAQRDMNGVSGIINEQKKFYKKIGLVFLIYVAALVVFYPLIAKTNIPRPYVITLILILCVSTLTEYFISLPYMSLLSADQKLRINDMVSITYTLAGLGISVVLASFKVDIRWIYLGTCVLGLLKPLFYTLYVKKHYDLNKSVPANQSAMKQRWNGMAHHFAYYIHKNTDAAILTILVSTAFVSIYNVYGAIVFGISRVVSSISSGSAAGLGNILIEGNRERIDRTVNLFELLQSGLTTVMYSITALMLIPFIRLYTVSMMDADYMQPTFGYILIFAEAVFCFRTVYSTISTSANKFKETQAGAILECAINLGVSILLAAVFKMDLVGIAIGTALGSLSRYIFEIAFLSKNVIHRPICKAIKMAAVSMFASALSILLCRSILNYNAIETAVAWVVYAIISTLIVGIVSALLYLAFYKETIILFVKRLKGR